MAPNRKITYSGIAFAIVIIIISIVILILQMKSLEKGPPGLDGPEGPPQPQPSMSTTTFSSIEFESMTLLAPLILTKNPNMGIVTGSFNMIATQSITVNDNSNIPLFELPSSFQTQNRSTIGSIFRLSNPTTSLCSIYFDERLTPNCTMRISSGSFVISQNDIFGGTFDYL